MERLLFAHIIVLGLLLAGCNDDVFIERLEMAPQTAEMGPDCSTAFLKVSGNNWYVYSITYSDGNIYTFGAPGASPEQWDGNVLNIVTSRSSLSVTVRENGVEVNLDRYLGDGNGCLIIDIAGQYRHESAEITIMPTGSYDIKITGVEYNLGTWSSYPEKDYVYNLYTLDFTQGLDEPMEYAFAQVASMPIVYYFRIRGNETEYARRLLDSQINIPVPEYTWYASADTPQPWVLLGREVPLAPSQSYFDSSVMIPPMPEPVALPSGTPLEVTLLCQQECVGLELTVSAIEPVTGETVEVPMELIMYRPEKFTAEVAMK